MVAEKKNPKNPKKSQKSQKNLKNPKKTPKIPKKSQKSFDLVHFFGSDLLNPDIRHEETQSQCC